MARTKFDDNANNDNSETRLEISSCLRDSPLAVKIFLDSIAELIAEAILEKAAQGRLPGDENTSPSPATAEAP